MWYVSGLSCRNSGSWHSHIDEVVYYVPTGITFSFLIFILSCASMLWIEWISYFFDFVLSLVLFDGLIITLLCCFVNTFLYFYINIFVYYLFYVFIFYYLFVLLIIFCLFICFIRLVDSFTEDILYVNWIQPVLFAKKSPTGRFCLIDLSSDRGFEYRCLKKLKLRFC